MYTAKDIRNICLLGHGGEGKTSLAESMLYVTKATDRLGKISDGNTVGDFDPEEIKRKYTISAALLPVEYKGVKLNFLDTPGYFDFAGEVAQALRVADSGVIVVSAKGGITVGAEKSWKRLKDADLPTFFYVSKLDEEHADYFKVLEALREKWGSGIIPFQFPMMEGGKTVGYVDLITHEAFTPDGTKTQMDSDSEARAELYFGSLREAVAETSEELMEKFFGDEEFTKEELTAGIRAGILGRDIIPVFCGCAVTGFGTDGFLHGMSTYAPSPLEGKPLPTAEGEEIKLDPAGSPMAFAFKTLSDQFGKNTYFKVFSGDLEDTMTVANARTGDNEKLSNMFFPKGKNQVRTSKVACGDIGVATKLSSVRTGDTIGLAGKTTRLQEIEYDEPCYTMAIYAKTKGQEDKIAAGLVKLNEEDASFRYETNPETKEMLISGVGDIHLNVICSKLLNKFKVEAELQPAKIAYRETIKKKVEIHGRHKKQSGGHGQFGDVYIRFEPQTETEDLVFADETVGGCVPKQFIPSVEKGLRNCIGKGVLAGYPVVNLKATLYFGSFHPVDSSDMAFQTAAGIAYKEGMPTANPTILEPIGTLKVRVPDSNMGDVIGDLNKRRGRIMGMNPIGDGNQEVEAEVPIGEMSSYAIDLRSMTQGRGSYSLNFVRYEEVPQMNQAKIIEAAKAAEEG